MQKAETFARALPGWAMVALLLVASILPVLRMGIASAAGEGIVSTDIVSQPSEDVHVTGIQITGSGNDEVSLRVEVDSGEFYIDDTTNVSVGYGDSGDNVFTITGLREDVNASLASLYFYGSRELYTVDLTLVDGNYNPENGHIYQVVADAGISWADAKTAAEGMTNGGVTGYLATITSQQEHDFIRARINDSGWIGSNDLAVEGEWRWVTGPEAGDQFWAGDEVGSAFGGAFANWNDGEPNNSGEGENCGQIYFTEESDGQWNDLDCTSDENEYYVVEFGAEGDLPDVVLDSFIIDLRGDTSVTQVASCDQLFELGPENIANTIELVADIDCQNRTEAPLFDGEDFYGVFEGNGFTIKNLTITNEDGEHVGLTGYSVGATYRNIFLDNIRVNGSYHNGVLAGHVNESIIAENIHATNISMSGMPNGSYVEEMGVLFGTIDLEHQHGPSRIEHVSVQGSFAISDVDYVYAVGGLVGQIEAEGDFVIKQAYADVNITIDEVTSNTDSIGGLVGYWDIDGENDNEDKDVAQGIDDSYSWGSITTSGGTYVGGLLGVLDNDNEDDADMSFSINDSYSWMDITSSAIVGGLIGRINNIENQGGTYSFDINNSFFAGELTGDTNIGIIIGIYEDFVEEYSTLSFDNVWYDADKVDGYDCVGNMGVDECNAANSDGSQPNYFIDNKVSAPIDEWNFDTIWRTQAGTPPVFKPFIGNDGDQDDVNDYIESRAPNGGDANNDGIQDSEQANVSSFVGSVKGSYISVAVDSACSLSRIGAAAESTKVVQDGGYSYPAGLINFTADCGTPGYTTSANLYFYDVDGNLTVRKHNPNNNAYFTVSSATKSLQSIGGASVTVVSYQITDGGELDIDSEVNGVIVDPVGLGVLATGVPNTGVSGFKIGNLVISK